VKAACDALLAAYTGDFLETILRDFPEDFEPWVSNWARKPFTLYRDYYLAANWYAAEYERQLGQQQDEEAPRRIHFGSAAQLYRTYAMRACDNRFDLKVTFGDRVRLGERVVMSERAFRRCVVLYGEVGSTHLVDEVFTAYYKLMRQISGKAWEPSNETLADLEAAKQRTGEYRLPKQITPHDVFSQQMDITEHSV
jgi:hypothetical protein